MRGIIASLLLSWSASSVGQDWYSLADPDQSDWSEKRKATYEKFAKSGQQPAGAVISIASLGIEAPVFSDTVSDALEGGVSHVSGTAIPGEPGNVALAGHRDSFFRKLEGIPTGIEISLTTPNQSLLYEVTEVTIVDALDVSPLDDTGEDVLTLITCHPFYYKGYAPDRYIVRATLVSPNSQE